MRNTSVVDLLLIAIAVVAFGLTAVLAMAPAILPAPLVDAIDTLETAVDPELAVLAVGGLVALFALWRSYASGASDATPPPSSGPTDPAPTAGVVGRDVTDRVAYTTAALEHGRDIDLEMVRADLRETLVAIDTARGRSADDAAERIRRGEWTDDRIAAVFLGDVEAGTLSLWHRLRRWLFPARTFERRLERTMTELERYADDDSLASDPTADGSRQNGGGTE